MCCGIGTSKCSGIEYSMINGIEKCVRTDMQHSVGVEHDLFTVGT